MICPPGEPGPGELLIKEEAEPGPYGYAPRERPIDIYLQYGAINLDKPSGPTSHEVTKWVRSLLGFPGRVGHCGTLGAWGPGISQGYWCLAHPARESNEAQ